MVSALRRRNKAERQGLMSFSFIAAAGAAYGSLNDSMSSLNAIDDTSIAEVHCKEQRYARLARSPEYRQARLAADAWCAAFVWKKTKAAPPPVTHEVFCRLLTAPEQVPEATCEEITRLAEQYNFLHWHLAFPDVFRVPADDEEPENEQTGWSGGFDVVLGNPPWDQVQARRKRVLRARVPEIAGAQRMAARDRAIAQLSETDPLLHAEFLEEQRSMKGPTLHSRIRCVPTCGHGRLNSAPLLQN